MKALLIPLAACAALAGCAVYDAPYYGYGQGYGYSGYTGYAYPAYPARVYQSYPNYYVYNTYPQQRYYRDRDRDRDGIPNRMDADRDNDGVPNRRDAYPNNPRRN